MSQPNDIDALKYPVGKFRRPEIITEADLQNWIVQIELLPERLNEIMRIINKSDLALHYRPDGWNIQQIIHHIADSHMNAFIRIKLALTEDNPTIKPYDEKKWANLSDVAEVDVQASVKIIEGIHMRWTTLLNSLTPDQWERTFIHPESGRSTSIKEVTSLYAWHGNHHIAHISSALSQQ